MTISHVLQSDNNASTGRIRFRPSWKSAALFAIPVCVVGAAGFAYYMYKRKYTGSTDSTDVTPKTPLEKAVSLKNRGNKFFKAGQYSKALQLYDEGLEICPEDAISERAALYQNRAAAKENLRQYDSAVLDCNLALELSPRYIKALNRRAHLFEKLEKWEQCLADVVACCILEQFKNTENIICMDQVLKKVGQKKAQEEWDTITHTLPSAAFIRNYLSAFAWNPFEVKQSTVNGTAEDESVTSPDSLKPPHGLIPEPFQTAYATLSKALIYLAEEKYQESMDLASDAVTQFETAISKSPSTESSHHMAEGDDSTAGNSIASEPDSTQVNGETSHDETLTTTDQIAQAKAALQRASLLYATYLALAGRANEVKERIQSILAEDSGADSLVRVNALIKSACLSMSVDQDFAACLYDFQTAQSTCPECPDIYLHRGQINLLADQLDEALHDLNTAVKLKPEFSIAQAQRLYTMYRKAVSDSNPDRATSLVEDFKRLTKKYPNCLETHSLFAQVLTERGEFSASDEQFAEVIKLAPDSGLAYAHRGLLQLRWGQNREAAHKWFTLGVQADPKCELIHELLGQMAVERGEFDKALEHFGLAIKESKTQNDLAHLIALREGVQTQRYVCQKYGLSVTDVMNSLKREQQHLMGLV